MSEQELHVTEMVVRLLDAKEVMLHPAVATQLVDSLLQLASVLQRTELAGSNSTAPAAEAVLQELQAALLSPPTPGQQQQQWQQQDGKQGKQQQQSGQQQQQRSGQRQQELHKLSERLGFRPAELHAAQAGLALQTARALHGSKACTLAACSGIVNSGAASADRGGRRGAGNSLHRAPAAAASALEALLRLAADLPQVLPSTGQLSSLQGLVVGRLLPLMRQVPLCHQPLSTEGWQSYFLLEPQALQQCLAEILQARTSAACPAVTGTEGRAAAAGMAAGAAAGAAAATPPGGSTELGTAALPPPLAALSQIVAQQAHWQAAADAVAAQPALHLLARRTLHSWLGESGSLAACELLVWLLQHAAAAATAQASCQASCWPASDGFQMPQNDSGAQQAAQPSVQEQRPQHQHQRQHQHQWQHQHQRQHQHHNRQHQHHNRQHQHQRQPATLGEPLGALPLPLRVLYPAGPARQLAALLHATPPSLPGLAQAASLLEQQQPSSSRRSASAVSALGSASLLVGAEPLGHLEGAAAGGGAVVAQQLWEALLDHPAWLSLALEQLPLEAEAAAAAAAAPASEPTAAACAGQSPGNADSQAHTFSGGGLVSRQEGDGAAEAQQAAAAYVGWVMWPHNWRRRELLQEALRRQPLCGESCKDATEERRVDVRAVLPWLQTLLRWQQHWAAGLGM